MLRKIFLIAFLRIVHFESISSLSIVKHNNKLHCMLSNDTASAAITWDYRYKATFEYITIDNIQDVWTLQKSEETEFAGVPILDYRWELFDMQTVCLYKLPVFSTFKMAISIQGSDTVDLCETVNKENCYKVILSKNGPFRSNDETRQQCSNYNKIPKDSRWLHFTLSLRDHIFYIKQHEKVKTLDLQNTFSPKYLVIDSKWKIHSFSVYSSFFLGTSKITLKTHMKKDKMLCFGLLVYVPNYSTINISLENWQKNVVPKSNTKMREWEEIQVCGNVSEEATLIIITSSPTFTHYQTDLFYIANIVRKFKQPDIRMATLEEKDENAHHCCYNIKSSTKLCTQNLTLYNPPGDQHCLTSSIGVNCIPCRRIFNQADCENVPICDSTLSYGVSCSCPSGYRNSGCTEKCPEGYYGFDCKQHCSDCQGNCSHVTGKCSSTNCTSNDCTVGNDSLGYVLEPPTFHTTIVNETTVSVSWQLPDVRTDSTEYVISYRHTNYRACPINEYAEPSKATLTVDKNSILLKNLRPYSNYAIEIAPLGSTKTPQHLDISTSDSAKLSKDEIPEIYTFQNGNQLLLRLEITNCSILRGSISYAIEIRCRSEWCQQKDDLMANITNNLNVTIKHTVSGFTNYTLNIRVHRNSSFIDIQRTLLTEDTGLTPAAVRNVTVYMVTNTTIGIRWLNPYSPTGVLGQYQVEWGIESPSWKRIFYRRSHFCKIWTEYVCAEFNELQPNNNYVFEIKAFNENSSMYGPHTKVAAITRNSVPSEPKNITYFWHETNNALALKWEHPDIPNGRIIGFTIRYYQHHTKWKWITNESLEYDYEFQYIELNTTSSSNIALQITAVNHVYHAKSHTLTIFTPPKTPKFLHNLSVIDTTSNTVRIQVPKLLDIDGESSRLFLLVTDKKPLSNSLFNYEKVIARRAGISEGQNFWIAVYRPLYVSSLESDEIDIGSELLEYLNPQTTYEIYLLLENQYKDISRYAVLKLDITTLERYNYMLLLLLLLLLLVIPVVSSVLIFRSRRKIKMNKATNGAISSSAVPIPENAIEGLYEEPKLENEYEEPQLENEYEEPKLENQYEEVVLKTIPNGESYSTPLNHLTIPSTLVKPELISTNEENHMSANLLTTCAVDVDTLPIELQEFKRYVRHCLQNHEFENQHRRALSKILLDSSKVCECNIQLPNAKSIYINGYDTTKAYIATEAPRSTKNVNYFWKMIWQENVEHIIMIADSAFLSTESQEKYWPDINKTKYYGDITINCFGVTQCAHYTRTLLILIFEGKPRQIQHLHFTAWCHDALPFYPQNLVAFLKETATIPHKKSSIAIHSNRGSGRIATFIICDLCLRSAKEAGKLDVYSCLCKLRQQGVGIDNVDQYKLVHLILLHCLVESDNGILCTKDVGKTINYILSSALLSQQMMYVDDNSWQDEAILEMCTKVQLVMEAEKNKTMPDGYTAVVSNPLSLPRKKLPSYIDVIEVDRFRTPSKFIVAKYPAQATLTKFWQFVEECEIGAILCLNELSLKDMDYCKFYPSYEEKMHLESDLEILCTGVMKELHYNLYIIDINDYKCEQKKKTVKILHTNGWKYEMLHPKSPETLLMLHDEMNRLTDAKKPILITCSDGIRGSGLFTSLCYLIEKIKIESICDVCLAVRTVRRSRPEFVKDLEQFSFLYQTALYYVQHSEANI